MERSEKRYTTKLQVGADLFLVGEWDKLIIASVMGAYDGHRGWINYLAVSPQYQGLGHGRKLMETIELRIMNKGCPKVNVQVRSSNADTIAFYEAIGYANDNVVGLGKRLRTDN